MERLMLAHSRLPVSMTGTVIKQLSKSKLRATLNIIVTLQLLLMMITLLRSF